MRSERLPLANKKILLTTVMDKQEKLGRLLAYWGAEIIEFPFVSAEALRDYQELDQTFTEQAKYHWIVFTNITTVDYFIARLLGNGFHFDDLKTTNICAIGLGVAERLTQFGLPINFMPAGYSVRAIIDKLHTEQKMGKEVLIITSKVNHKILQEELPAYQIAEGLQHLGVTVQLIHAHYVHLLGRQLNVRRTLPNIDILVLTDFLSIRMFKEMEIYEWKALRKSKIATIGPIAAAKAKELGFFADIVPKHAGIENLVEEIINSDI